MNESIVIAAEKRPDGRIAAVTTNGIENRIWQLGAETWEPVLDWVGSPVKTFCSCGESLVAVDDDSVIHVIGAHGRREISTPAIRSIFAAAAVTTSTVLLGGATGKLALLDLHTSAMTGDSLAAHGVANPGRSIFSLQRIGPELYVLGDNQLLIGYQNGAMEALLPPGKRTERVFKLWYMGRGEGEETLVSGYFGLDPIVAVLRGAELSVIDAPTTPNFASPLTRVGQSLYLLGGGLWVRTASGWAQQLSGSDENPFVFVGERAEARIVAVMENGECVEPGSAGWCRVAGIP